MKSNPGVADSIRTLELRRLRSLVEKDIPFAETVHSRDFQLVTPTGVALSRQQYLDSVATGEIDYRVWEVTTGIDVRLVNGMAAIRYQSRMVLSTGGSPVFQTRCWHTDTYEMLENRWQVVLSHATIIAKTPV